MSGHIKALHICETIRGGTATYLRTFDAACGAQVDSHFLIPASQADAMDPAATLTLYPRRNRGVMALFALTRQALALTKDGYFAILIFHSTFTLGVMLVLRLCGRRGAFIYIPHGWSRSRYGASPLRAFCAGRVEGWLAGFADSVLNVSHYDRDLALAHRYRGRQRVVENAVADLSGRPLRRFRARGRINLLFVGRLDHQKGVDILLEAFARAVRHNPALHLHLVGASPEERAGLPQHPHVTWHGWQSPQAVAQRYAEADVTILPSRWEGLPMVLLESLRAGTPVMVSDVCGQGGLVGGAGLAVPLSVADFEAALRDLSPDTLLSMRPLARRMFESRFHIDRFAQETLAVLAEALTTPRHASRHAAGQVTGNMPVTGMKKAARNRTA